MQEDYKLFVTVGTTSFDGLVKSCKLFAERHRIRTLIQTPNAVCFSDSRYVTFIDFSDSIFQLYQRIEFVVAHAGAGTCYQLAELQKNFLIVPNLERSDTHQKDLARYFKSQRIALVCENLDEVDDFLGLLLTKKFQRNKYKKDEFFKAKEIVEFILDEN